MGFVRCSIERTNTRCGRCILPHGLLHFGTLQRINHRHSLPPSLYFTSIPRTRRLLGLATVSSLLGSFDTGRVGLGSSGFSSQLLHQSTAGLEWPREVALCLFTEEVEFGRVGLEDTLEGHEALDKERLGVVHVAVLDVSRVQQSVFRYGRERMIDRSR